MKFQIERGTPYQIINSLFESANQQTADLLQIWADLGECRIVSRDESIDLGFEELGNWSNPQTDVLFLLDDSVLIAINRQCFLGSKKEEENG